MVTLKNKNINGFTLMELLLVMTLLAILAGISAPVVSHSIRKSKEATLKEDLQVMRKTIDDYYADVGHYPKSLKVLVEDKYLRKIPVDPFTGRNDSWVEINTEDNSGIIDVKSGVIETNQQNSLYKNW